MTNFQIYDYLSDARKMIQINWDTIIELEMKSNLHPFIFKSIYCQRFRLDGTSATSL